MDGGEWILRIQPDTRKNASVMQRLILSCLISLASFSFLLALLSDADASVTTFGTGSNQFDMTFVEIGNPNNPGDTTGKPNPAGSVAYKYQMGKYEVSEGMIDKFNASQSLTIGHGSRGVDKPVTSVTWNEAARFVNWMNTSQGHQAAYNFTSNGVNDDIALWSSEEAWQLGGENLFRHKDAYYFLPSTDEWYKAAYYEPVSETYFDYPSSDGSKPTAVASGTDPNTAVYDQTALADITQAGGLNPYGIMAMAGNASEWEESWYYASNNTVSSPRASRGGYWSDGNTLSSTTRYSRLPNNGSIYFGFRVASVASADADADAENVIPEPGSLAVWSLLGLAGFHVSRRFKK